MSKGLTEEDARLVAAAMLETIKVDYSTAQNAKNSVVRILEGAGSRVAANMVANTDPLMSGVLFGAPLENPLLKYGKASKELRKLYQRPFPTGSFGFPFKTGQPIKSMGYSMLENHF